MRIKIGTAPIKKEEINYSNEIVINFTYNNLNEQSQKKYSEIIQKIRTLNKDTKIKIIINSTNSVSSNDIEVEYKIELTPKQFPTKELNSFYLNFTNFLHEFKKKSLEENINETAMDNLLKTYEFSTLPNQKDGTNSKALYLDSKTFFNYKLFLEAKQDEHSIIIKDKEMDGYIKLPYKTLEKAKNIFNKICEDFKDKKLSQIEWELSELGNEVFLENFEYFIKEGSYSIENNKIDISLNTCDNGVIVIHGEIEEDNILDMIVEVPKSTFSTSMIESCIYQNGFLAKSSIEDNLIKENDVKSQNKLKNR